MGHTVERSPESSSGGLENGVRHVVAVMAGFLPVLRIIQLKGTKYAGEGLASERTVTEFCLLRRAKPPDALGTRNYIGQGRGRGWGQGQR